MNADTFCLFLIVLAACLLVLRWVQVFVTERVYRSRIINHQMLFSRLTRRVYTRDDVARKIMKSFYFSWFPYVPKSLIDDMFQMVKEGNANNWTTGSGYSILVLKSGQTDFSRIDSDMAAVPDLAPNTYKVKGGALVSVSAIFFDNIRTRPVPVNRAVSTMSMQDSRI